jgi:uncharacterized protein (TIGR02466 family)
MNKEISNFLITYTKNINHSNGFFIEHLIGVYNILKEINQDEDVCLAGLFHSIYGTDSFKLDLNIKRDEIKKLIGNYSEELVFDFCNQKNKETFYLNNTNYFSKKKELDLFYISYANLKEQCDRTGSFRIKDFVHKYEQKIIDLKVEKECKEIIITNDFQKKEKLQKYNIDTWFPKSVYIKDNVCLENLNNFESEIKKTFSKYGHKRYPLQNVDSIYETFNNLHNINEFNFLTNIIYESSYEYLNELGYKNKQLKITEMWSNISYEKDHLFPHNHSNSVLSGAFYVKGNSNNKIKFFDNSFDMMPKPQNFNYLNYKYCEYDCIPGRLLLFRSDFLHGTESQYDNEKIVISFNLKFSNEQ